MFPEYLFFLDDGLESPDFALIAKFDIVFAVSGIFSRAMGAGVAVGAGFGVCLEGPRGRESGAIVAAGEMAVFASHLFFVFFLVSFLCLTRFCLVRLFCLLLSDTW